MVKPENISTYVIKSSNENAYAAGSNGKLLRDEDGTYIQYDKEDVLNVVVDLINNDVINKGVKVDPKKGQYIVYSFTYIDPETNKKYIHRIKVSKKYLKENEALVSRLDAMVKSSIAIKKVNIAKGVLEGVAVALIAGTLVFGFEMAAERDFQIRSAQSEKRLEEINEERRENNLPPLGATYEEGDPFEGSYIDWAKYVSGYTDRDGNVIEEEEETRIMIKE